MKEYYLGFDLANSECRNIKACRFKADKKYCFEKGCDIAGPSGGCTTSKFDVAIDYLIWALNLGENSTLNWNVVFKDRQIGLYLYIEKTADGCLCDLSFLKDGVYENFPPEIRSWFLNFGDDETPCLFEAEGGGEYYVPQRHYMPARKVRDTLYKFQKNGVLYYDPKYWSDQNDSLKRMDYAPEELRIKLLGDPLGEPITYWEDPDRKKKRNYW